MISLADIRAASRSLLLVAVIIVVTVLCILLANSCSDVATLKSDNGVLRSNNTLQAAVIAKQAFNLNRFNQVAEYASRNNSLIDASADNRVIEYREILRREKTCNLPVPADVSRGLLEYSHRLRASAIHADSGRVNAANNSTAAAGSITYYQAVLWVKLLPGTIEKGNNNFADIREIEKGIQ